jgi:hypothetical protein
VISILHVRGVLLVACFATVFAQTACRRELRENALFPSSNEAAGWVKNGDIRTFEAANLWKYIDGEAERYLKAGVQRVFTADYKFKNTVDAVVDIYVMGNARGAEKILDDEPALDAKPLQLGDSARLYNQSLVFRKGRYLVRIVAYEESAETPQALLDLGRAIEGKMTDK